MLQALYFCKPFREHVLNYRLTQKNKKENLLICLADLFHMIVSGKRRTGALQPKKFINKLRKENSKNIRLNYFDRRLFILGTFDNDMQQDAHEFLNHLLNTCADILLGLEWIYLLLNIVCLFFILAEKKEEKEKHDKQRNKSNSVSFSHNQCNGDGQSNRTLNSSDNPSIEDTWIHELFQGTLVSTTKCLNCETVC